MSRKLVTFIYTSLACICSALWNMIARFHLHTCMSDLQEVLGILATAYDLSGQAQRDFAAQEIVFAHDMEEFEVRSPHHHVIMLTKTCQLPLSIG
jgi:hypothetical protein